MAGYCVLLWRRRKQPRNMHTQGPKQQAIKQIIGWLLCAGDFVPWAFRACACMRQFPRFGLIRSFIRSLSRDNTSASTAAQPAPQPVPHCHQTAQRPTVPCPDGRLHVWHSHAAVIRTPALSTLSAGGREQRQYGHPVSQRHIKRVLCVCCSCVWSGIAISALLLAVVFGFHRLLDHSLCWFLG